MGTRGIIGFRYNNIDKVTYNHFDSYPSCLGKKIILELQSMDIENAKDIFDKIIMVNESDKATPKQIQEIIDWEDENGINIIDLTVSKESISDWYCLLRKNQGTLQNYLNGLPYMIDNSEFLLDSLMCEWAYIVNLDDERLEIYRGYNKNQNAFGRYARFQHKNNDEYYGVEIVGRPYLIAINECWGNNDIDQYIEIIENEV